MVEINKTVLKYIRPHTNSNPNYMFVSQTGFGFFYLKR